MFNYSIRQILGLEKAFAANKSLFGMFYEGITNQIKLGRGR